VNRYFFITLLLILSIFFIGCNSSNTPIVLVKEHKVQNLPSWYLSAPNNNQDFLYGIGAALTLSQAKNEALNSLASRLFISISSNTHSIKSSDSFENYSSINNQEIFLEVEKIDLLNSKIEKSIKVNDEYFVLLSIDRKKLFKEYFFKLDAIDRKISQFYDKAINLSNIFTISYSKEILDLIDEAFLLTKKLSVINENFNKSQYDLKYHKIKFDLLNLRKNIKLKIKSNHFLKSLKSYISRNNILLSNKNFDAIVSSFENINYSKYNNWFIAKCNISVEILVNAEVLSTNNFTIIGRSTHSNFQALENAKKSLEKKLLNIDINNFLGIK
jgi:hypothetical protein